MIDIEVHLERLAQDPVHEEALEAVESAYAEGERWEELLRLYEANSLNALEDDAARLLVRASTICLEKMGSAQRAEAYLEQAASGFDIMTGASLTGITFIINSSEMESSPSDTSILTKSSPL